MFVPIHEMPPSLSVAEAAAAVSRSSTTINRWIHSGKLHAFRMGYNVRIPVAEVERLVRGVPAGAPDAAA